ncbi:MAG: hypothetical protein ACD_71C00209G0005 [uncultured bacterium (gcode 4)]|uniref:Uncharacterized protein n=1 Tax=uncultured bacterium (gcode 4) TaxID=1234023 RepID=K1ZIH4_9BACT|nr:MAG: hypothetical protein ACD_71C00209G0005 [uncultured bacterium (gcode 4)]
MKAIIFDIDWVIIKSGSKKDEVIKSIIQKHHLYDIPWVKEIPSLWINRKLIVERIYELTPFDKETVLKNINNEMAILESNPIKNENIINFINKNYKKYLFFTNTSLPIDWLNKVFDSLWIKDKFQELLAFENGSKAENIYFVMKSYDIKPTDILFIDDNVNHIDLVKETWVHTLHFTDYDIDVEKYIASYG